MGCIFRGGLALEIDLLYCCYLDRHSEPSVWCLLVYLEGGYPECIRDYRLLDDIGKSAAWVYGCAKLLGVEIHLPAITLPACIKDPTLLDFIS